MGKERLPVEMRVTMTWLSVKRGSFLGLCTFPVEFLLTVFHTQLFFFLLNELNFHFQMPAQIMLIPLQWIALDSNGDTRKELDLFYSGGIQHELFFSGQFTNHQMSLH